MSPEERERLLDVMARAICYCGHTRDQQGHPPSDQFMVDLYGVDWPEAFIEDAHAVLAALERAGYGIVPPGDGR